MKTSLQNLCRCSAFSLAALLAVTGTVHATDPADTSTAASKPLSHRDLSFFNKAAKAGAKEVAVSEAVMDRLNHPEVRDFAKAMISDHSDLNDDLQKLATRKGVMLPAKEPKLGEKWGLKAKGADKAYVNEMIDDHEDAVKLFAKASKSDDADVALFAQKILPALRHHLAIAKDLKKLPL